jgi:hypothetical protein
MVKNFPPFGFKSSIRHGCLRNVHSRLLPPRRTFASQVLSLIPRNCLNDHSIDLVTGDIACPIRDP